jgi:dGTPase
MLNKQALEEREVQWLAPYAALSVRSLGRLYPELPPTTRTEFQRDRDRVIHSKAFRRLKHKTQVFVATERGDHYRTRLTHTLEVAQIARQLSRVLQVNEDLAETIALAHDLGHTPFGHSGETVLNHLMSDAGGFEHNRQSKKIVEKLEKKYVEFNGLNLTAEVVDGLIKHRSPYDHGIVTEHGPSLEAQITNIADEIAYNSHDLDDGISSGVLTLKQLATVEIWRELTAEHRAKYTNLSPKNLHSLNVRRLIDMQINSVLVNTEALIQQHAIQSYQDVLLCPETLVDFSPVIRPKIIELRQFLHAQFYDHPRIIKKNKKAEDVLGTLFLYYLQHPEQINESSMFLAESTGKELACDYVAGMTDQFALKAYRKIRRVRTRR